MAEVTRKSVLTECLEYERGLKRMCSVDREGRIPLQGSEDLFYEQEKKCKIIEELIHALDNPEVRRILADWQKDVMENGPSALDLEGLPKTPPTVWYEGEWPAEPQMRL